MPEPVSRYHSPLAPEGSTPAACQRLHSPSCRCRNRWAREANAALASAIDLSAAAASLVPPILAGSAVGPDDHEVVVHDVEALDPIAGGDEFLLIGLGMHEQDVAIAVLGRS